MENDKYSFGDVDRALCNSQSNFCCTGSRSYDNKSIFTTSAYVSKKIVNQKQSWSRLLAYELKDETETIFEEMYF